jgi:hypothetical protein
LLLKEAYWFWSREDRVTRRTWTRQMPNPFCVMHRRTCSLYQKQRRCWWENNDSKVIDCFMGGERMTG